MHLPPFLSTFSNILRFQPLIRLLPSSFSLSPSMLTSPSPPSSNLRLLPPPPSTLLPAPSLILFIPSSLTGSIIEGVLGPAERWKEEGFWVLEVQMDEDGTDLELVEGGWGWKQVLNEGREWLISQEGVDKEKAVGIVAHSPPVPLLLHLSSLPVSQTLFSSLILPGSTSLLPSLSLPIQSHLSRLPWDLPSFNASLEISLADENTFVYEHAETRDWMCPASGGWRRREDAEEVYKRGGEFLRGALGRREREI
ncbi:hypothetical protein BDY24DRAFT_389673 [Mrakia frigida]|uniref:uncharacterized protein n=1 Tax=Mrakia frigida TaxID=29902 RepID=UPI003FCBF377